MVFPSPTSSASRNRFDPFGSSSRSQMSWTAASWNSARFRSDTALPLQCDLERGPKLNERLHPLGCLACAEQGLYLFDAAGVGRADLHHPLQRRVRQEGAGGS